MAERFQEQVNLQPVDTRTGAAQGIVSLSEKLNSFKTLVNQRAAQEAAKRGQISAGQTKLERKDGITQTPEFQREGFFGRNEAIAHNTALRGAYVASIGNDITSSVGAIEAENSQDLIKFNDSIEALTKGMLTSVDPTVRGEVATFLEGKATAARTRVHGREIKKQRSAATAEMTLASDNATNDAFLLARDGDFTGAAEKVLELFANLDEQVAGGILTPAEATIKKRDAELGATREGIVGGIKAVVKRGDYSGALDAIIKFREKVPQGFTIDEHDEVVTAMTAEVNEAISLDNKLEDAEKDTTVATHAGEYVRLFSGISTGTANAQDVLAALNNGTISSKQASTLTTTLNTRGKGVDEWSLVTRIQDGIRNGEDMRSDIISNTGTNLTEATAATLLAGNDVAEDSESLLATSKAKRAQGFITQSMRVTGPFGALDTEAERRLANSRREFGERVLAGQDPWRVADDLVGKDDFDRAPNPKFGTKQDLDGALETLNAMLLSNQVDDDTFNFEFAKLERLIKLRDNIENFNKSRKESQDADR